MACKECREEFGTGEVRIGEAGTERTGGSWSGLVSPALERSGQAGEERCVLYWKEEDRRVAGWRGRRGASRQRGVRQCRERRGQAGKE